MTRKTAIFGSLLFFLVAPVTVAGIVPWWISRWHADPAFLGIDPLRLLGAVFVIPELLVLIASFTRFAVDGFGTPAPIAPPRRLVVRGFYRYVRNPMYVAILAIVFGQAILLGNLSLLAYGAAFWLACHLFVILYEEPNLRRRFGNDYEMFRAAVPRWLPRLRPWSAADNRGQTMLRVILLICTILSVASAVEAQSLQEIDRRYASLLEAWEKTPLTVRRTLFVAGHPQGFGLYQERASNVFKPGEALVTYAEPVGYGAKDAGNGLLEFGFAVDFLIKSPDGQILTGQQDFARLTQQSHVRNLEFMLLLTLNVTGAPAGDYVVEYKLRDISGDKSTSFELPFKIAS